MKLRKSGIRNKSYIFIELIRIITICFILLISGGQQNKPLYNISDKINYSDFQILYESQIDSYSSKDSLFSRSYIDGTSKIKCFLTVVDKRNILQSMKENEFLDLPDVLPEDKNAGYTLPAFPVRIIAMIGKTKKSVMHEGSCVVKLRSQLERFNKVLGEIQKSIYSKKEIKGLKQTDIIFE